MPRASAALLVALLAAGCTDGAAPPQLLHDLGADLSASAGDLGGTCKTACDCMPGEACRMGMCEVVAAASVFCCSSTTCTGSDVCEFSDGTISQCDHLDAGPVTPVVDGGIATNKCAMTSCIQGSGGDVFCRLACGGTATCVGGGGNPHCMP